MIDKIYLKLNLIELINGDGVISKIGGDKYVGTLLNGSMHG